MTERRSRGIDWRGGRTPAYVFFDTEESYEIGRKDYMAFFSETALGKKRAFQSIDSRERDVIDDGLSLFNASDGANSPSPPVAAKASSSR